MGIRGGILGAGLAFVGLVGFVGACSTSSSDGASPTTEAGVDATSASWKSGACGGCVETACAASRQLCDVEPSCAAHLACADQCGSGPDGHVGADCLAACPLGENEVASKARKAYDACITDPASRGCAACPKATDPGAVEILDQQCGSSMETKPCYVCEDQKCCHTYQACADDPNCNKELKQCILGCASDLVCKQGCYDKYPGSVEVWARRNTCMIVNCRAECGAAPDVCIDCGLTKCRTPYGRCNGDRDCFLISECVTRCDVATDACVRACKQGRSAASALLFDQWANCALLQCGDECSR